MLVNFLALLIMQLMNCHLIASDMSEKECILKNEGTHLFYKVIGKGKPLIVIHRGPGLSHDYLLLGMKELAESHMVIFYDQRGCGRSTCDISDNTISIEAFLSDLEAIRQALQVPKISLLGHSWGGFIAMHYAMAYPNHVENLILSNSLPSNSEDYHAFADEWTKRMLPLSQELNAIQTSQAFIDGESETIEQFYQLVFSTYCFNPRDACRLNLVFDSSATLNGRKVYAIFHQKIFVQTFDLSSSLSLIEAKTLIIHGDVDPIPYITAEHTRSKIKKAQFVLLKNCGHFPYIESPKAYFNTINTFLLGS